MLKHGDKKKIAKWLGLRPAMASKIFTGKKRPSAKSAKRMEIISGISLNDWLFLPVGKLMIKIEAAWIATNMDI